MLLGLPLFLLSSHLINLIMKISKLFHWCYAFLMLLPICAIGVKCGYVMLNKNANLSYMGTYSYSGTGNLANALSNVSIQTNSDYGRDKYYIKSNTLVNNFNVYKVPAVYNALEVVFNVSDLVIDNVEYNSIKSIYISNQSQVFLYSEYFDITDSYIRDWRQIVKNDINLQYQQVSFANKVINFTSIDNKLYCKTTTFSRAYLSIFTFDTFIVDTNLSSVFYSALQELDKVEFFSWAKNSFLAQPFMYIGNLFGIPNVHPIFTFLSYWCAISIIWLVFDLFMYMPLLVHKWIDKAKVE